MLNVGFPLEAYIGLSNVVNVKGGTLVVEEGNKAAEIEAEDDISEPDEGKIFSFRSQ